MSKAKKIFLVRERRETWRFRLEKKRCGYCDECAGETLWLTLTEAAQIAAMTDRQMFRLADTAKIHHKDSDSGAFMICDRSLELEMTGSDKDVSSRSRKEVKE